MRYHLSRLRVLLTCGFLAAVSLSSSLRATERVAVTVLATTDLHGRISPLDYSSNQPAQVGLAKIGTLIRAQRQRDPGLLLLDCGDTIQGTPLAYYHNRVHNAPPDPMMAAMNALGYDAMAIGNHEYNFGLEVLHKAEREAAFPWLSGNTYRTDSGEPAYAPYLVKETNGVRIGVIGLTTPGIPMWENPENFAGLEFGDPVAAARRWVEVLQEKEKVDAVVIAMHMGLEENLAKSSDAGEVSTSENLALAIARTVPGVDLILMGHTHRRVPALVVNGVLLAQAGRWGDHLIEATLYFARESAEAPWTVCAKASEALPIAASVAPDPELLEIAAPYEAETQQWLDRVIGQCPGSLSAADASLRDNALLDLVHRTQLEAGNAEISFAANFNPRAHIPAGPVTVRDIASLYVYENTLYVVDLTGAQVKAALEHAARYFLPYEEGKSPSELIDPAIPAYNFDLAEGVSYTIDLRRPLGDRIVDLRFQGEPLDPARHFRVAINNYRYNGGGGYTMFKDAPIVYRSSEEIRNLIIAWIEQQREIPSVPTGNWQLAPTP